MLLAEKKMEYEHIVQISSSKNGDKSDPFFVVGRRFDKKYIFMVPSIEASNPANFDNSFFQVLPADPDAMASMKSSLDKTVRFGDQVLLKHINSGKYLSVAIECTESSCGYFKLLLGDKDKEKQATYVFQMQPTRSFEKIADPVKFDFNVHLYSPRNELFMNTEVDFDSRIRLMGSHDKDTKWRFRFYDSHLNTENDNIRDKDLVYLVNSKSGGLLTVRKNIKNQSTLEIKGERYEQQDEHDPYEFQFLIKDILPSYNSYPIKKEPKIFNCFWQVSLKPTTEGHFDMSFTHLTEDISLPYTMFTTLVGQDTDDQNNQVVRSGEFLQIGNYSREGQKEWLGDKKLDKYNRGKGKSFRGQHVDKHLSAYNIRSLDFIQDESQGDILVFKIAKVSLDLKRELYQLIEAKQKIEQFTKKVETTEKWLEQFTGLHDMGTKYRESMDILTHITRSFEKAMGSDTSKPPEFSVLQRQMILSDIGFIDVIIKCLHAFYSSHENIEAATRPAKNDIKKLFDKLHELLRLACQNNPHIKERMSRRHILELFDFAEKRTLSELDYDDTGTIREILSNNKHRTHNIISSQAISELIAKNHGPMSIENSLKFIRVLRLMCKSSEDAIACHQKIIVQEFLERQYRMKLEDESPEVASPKSDESNLMQVAPRINSKGEVVFYTLDLQWKNIFEMYVEFIKENQTEASRGKDSWRWITEWIQLLADTCQTKNIYGKRFAESIFSPRMFEYLIEIKQEPFTDNDFDPSHIYENLNRVKLHFHKYIIRLLDNVCVRTIYNDEGRFDLVYLTRSDQLVNYEKVLGGKFSNQTNLILKLRSFVKVYFSNFTNNYNMGLKEPEEKINDCEPTGKDNNLIDSMAAVVRLVKHLIIYGYMEEDSKEATIAYQKSLLRTFGEMLNIRNNIRESVKFMTPILEIVDLFIEMDTQDSRIEILDSLYARYRKDPHGVLDVEKILDQEKGFLRYKLTRFDEQIVSDIREAVLRLILFPVGENYEFFLLCKRLYERLMEMQRVLVQQLQNILVIDSTSEDIRVIKHLRDLRKVFEVFENRQLTNVTLETQYELNTPVWDFQDECLLKYLLELTSSMKTSAEEDCLRQYRDIVYMYKRMSDKNFLLTPYVETERPNRKVQKLVKQMGIHRQLFRYLTQFTADDENELSKRVVYLAYHFLAVFAWRNKENKIELSPLCQKMIDHAESIEGAIDTLQQFFTDNEMLILDSERVSKVTEKVTEYVFSKVTLADQGFDSRHELYYAAKLLDFLISLIEYKNIRLKENSIVVLSFILDKDRLKITKPQLVTDLYRLDRQIQDYELFFKGLNPRNQIANTEEVVIEMSPSLTYLAVLFGLLAKLVGDNEINMAKCKKLHLPETLAAILSKARSCWPLKANTRHYMNKLYYSQIQPQFYNIIMGSELDTIIDDLNEYIYARQQFKSMNRFRYCNAMRLTFYSTYLYINVQRILESLLLITRDKKMMQKIVTTDLRSGGGGDYASRNTVIVVAKFMRLYERLRLIKLVYFTDCTTVKAKIAEILMQLEREIFQIDFLRNQFINKNDKNFDYRELYKKIAKKSGDMNDYDELSLCCRALSNTELLMFFRSERDYREYVQGVPDEQRRKERHSQQMLLAEINSPMPSIAKGRNRSTSVYNHSQPPPTPLVPPLNLQKAGKRFSYNPSNLLQIPQSRMDAQSSSVSYAMEEPEEEEDPDIKPVLSFLDRSMAEQQRDSIIDIRYKTKNSVRCMIEAIMERHRPDQNLEPPTFEIYYRRFLKELFKQDEQSIMEPQKMKIEQLREKVQVVNRINDTICSHSEIFDMNVLAFHLRIYRHNFKELSKSKEPLNFLEDLNDSFSKLIFKCYSLCNLHENLEITYEFSKFVVTYFKCLNIRNSQRVLYDLIHQDPKSEFLVALDNNISQLSEEIVKGLDPSLMRLDELNREGVFCMRRKYFLLEEDELDTEFGETIRLSRIIESFRNTFVFMQLLCENNFVAFKKEFREQRGADDRIKLKNRNLLLRSTIELRRLLGVYTVEIKDIPEKILDFINEIAQIPCYDNQTELSKSTFFEDICQFVSDITTFVRANKEPAGEKTKQQESIAGTLAKSKQPKDHEFYSRAFSIQAKYTKSQFEQLYPHVVVIIERFLKIIVSLLESNIDEIYESFINKLDLLFFAKVVEMARTVALNYPRIANSDLTEKYSQIKVHILLIYKQLQAKHITEKHKLTTAMGKLINELSTGDKADPEFRRESLIKSIEVSIDNKEHKLYFFRPQEADGIDSDDEFLQDLECNLSRETQLQKLDSLLKSIKKLELYMVHRHYLRTKVPLIALFMTFSRTPTIISAIINIFLVLYTYVQIETGVKHEEQRFEYLIFLQVAQFICGTLYSFSALYAEKLRRSLEKANQQHNNDNGHRTEVEFAALDFSDYRKIFNEKISMIMYFVICLLGLLVSPLYYAMHLFYLFSKIEVLESVYKALVKNFKQLLWLALMGVGFFLVFSIMTLQTYAPFADEHYCETMLECFMVIYNKEVFVEDADIGQSNFRSLWYQLVYSVFFGSLFGNVISGLMTDTFAQLRARNNEIETDENNFCYVCGFTRYEIEKENKDKLKLRAIFSEHKKKHNKWSYLFYVFELKKRDSTEYTGLEYIISEKVKKNSVAWFPVKPEYKMKLEEIIQDLKQIDEL